MRLKVLLLATLLTSPAFADEEHEITIPCTTMKIVESDGVKTLTEIPEISFLEAIGKVKVGHYEGTTFTFTLQGSGNIECSLHRSTQSE